MLNKFLVVVGVLAVGLVAWACTPSLSDRTSPAPLDSATVGQLYFQAGAYHYFFGTVTGLTINGVPQPSVQGSMTLVVRPPSQGSLSLLTNTGILIDARVTTASLSGGVLTFTASGSAYVRQLSGTTTFTGTMNIGTHTGTITFTLNGGNYSVSIGF